MAKMIDFKDYISELAVDLKNLDLEFIKKAEVVTAFNIDAKAFQSTQYKGEVQYLFKKHFFPDFDISRTAPTLNEAKVNALVKELKASNKSSFVRMMRYTPKGVGPGEVMMYFLVDDLTLGGGASAGLDLGSGGKGYEMKACDISKGYFVNFKIGGTVDITKPLAAAVAIKKEMLAEKVKLKPKATEIGKGDIEAIKRSNWGSRWEAEVERPYKKAAYDNYFKNHATLFTVNKTPAKAIGEIFIRNVKADQIELDSVTSGTIKPKIKF